MVKPYTMAYLGRLFIRGLLAPLGFESGVALATVGAMSIDVPVMLLAAGRSTDC